MKYKEGDIQTRIESHGKRNDRYRVLCKIGSNFQCDVPSLR